MTRPPLYHHARTLSTLSFFDTHAGGSTERQKHAREPLSQWRPHSMPPSPSQRQNLRQCRLNKRYSRKNKKFSNSLAPNKILCLLLLLQLDQTEMGVSPSLVCLDLRAVSLEVVVQSQIDEISRDCCRRRIISFRWLQMHCRERPIFLRVDGKVLLILMPGGLVHLHRGL